MVRDRVNNISAISVAVSLLLEETGVPRKNTDKSLTY